MNLFKGILAGLFLCVFVQSYAVEKPIDAKPASVLPSAPCMVQDTSNRYATVTGKEFLDTRSLGIGQTPDPKKKQKKRKHKAQIFINIGEATGNVLLVVLEVVLEVLIDSL